MTNYEKITYALKKGLHVLVQGEYKRYLIISPYKDYRGDYRTSNYHNSIEGAKKTIGADAGFADSHLKKNAKDWIIIETFFTPFEPYEVGEEVVHEKYGVGFIKHYYKGDGNYLVNFSDSEFNKTLTHHVLKPHFTENPAKDLSNEDLIKELKSRGLTKDGTILNHE